MHAQLNAVLTAAGQAQQLDAVAELFGVTDIGRLQGRDAFHMRFVELHRHAESDGAHDGQLMRGVHAFDVESGVGLGIAQALRFFEHHVEVQALGLHFRQDEIGGAVDDAGDPLDAVGAQALAQGLDDGDAAGHRGFKRHHHALGARGFENLGAVHGQQGLVGRHHMLALGNRGQHQFTRQAAAADGLDHDVDLGVVDDGVGVGGHHNIAITHHGARGRQIAAAHHADFNATAGAAANLGLIALQHMEGARADGANAQQAYFDRFHGVFSFVAKCCCCGVLRQTLCRLR